MLSKLKLDLLSQGEPLLIGVSGGADSVALLDALVQSGYRPHVCHLNHQWRGAESDADAEFVRELAGRYGLPATIESRAVAGDEDAARQARLKFFESVAARTGIHTLALAHTADDQVETFLLRLLRGAGVAGLVGIWPERQLGSLRIIRPLLKVCRAEVVEYLKSRQLTWREDSSNTNRQFLRNRVRHELLPLLARDYNPGIRDVLLRTAEILREEDELLSALAEAVPIEALRGQPVALQRRALRRWLGEELDFDHIESVRQLALSDSASAEVALPDNVIVFREYDTLRQATREELAAVTGRWPLNLAGETVIGELGVTFVCQSERSEESLRATEALRSTQGDRNSERFDADALGESVFVRTWEDGDRFQPLGMSGERKLQDFFADEKVPRHRRGRVPLVCAADGRIAWIVGHRIAEPFKVTERTKRVVRLGVRG